MRSNLIFIKCNKKQLKSKYWLVILYWKNMAIDKCPLKFILRRISRILFIFFVPLFKITCWSSTISILLHYHWSIKLIIHKFNQTLPKIKVKIANKMKTKNKKVNKTNDLSINIWEITLYRISFLKYNQNSINGR